ncbi:MAG: MBL fold metallo-hydrolase [Pirellulales bacterium]|nr:MBL fold metallo-hydrolase [Pirellulales bacterium]
MNGILRYVGLAAILLAATARLDAASESKLQDLGGSLYRLQDTCNVYVLVRDGHTLIVDFGSGAVLPELQRRGWQSPDWVLHTHYHRDQCQGDRLLAGTKTKIAVPETERKFFEKAEEHWLGVKTYHNYQFKPDFLTSTYNIPVARGMKPGETLEWQGLSIKAIATPGHTFGHLAYAVELAGRRIVFSGDVVHSPGKVWNFHTLQYRYNDCGRKGLSNLRKSRDAIMAEKPDLLAPSHGIVMEQPAAALDSMLNNLNDAIQWMVNGKYPAREVKELPHLRRVMAVANSYLISNDAGGVFLVDAGNTNPLKEVEKDPALKRIEVIWVTHYHGDHVQAVNKIRKQYGSKFYCPAILREVMETPENFNIPCLIPYPTKVDRVLRDGESFTWSGIPMQSFFFPGQTHFHAGLLAEIDGKRVFFTGDSFDAPGHGHNYNCRNFIELDPHRGILRCVDVLERVKPDYLATGHWGIWDISRDDIATLRRWAEGLKPRFARLIAWDDPNFGMDENWVSIYPYKQQVQVGKSTTVEARIRNHSDDNTTLTLELVPPPGIAVKQPKKHVRIDPKQDAVVAFQVELVGVGEKKRYVIPLNVTRDGQNLGQLSECIIDPEL